MKTLLWYPHGGKLPIYSDAYEHTVLQEWELDLHPGQRSGKVEYKSLIVLNAIQLTY